MKKSFYPAQTPPSLKLTTDQKDVLVQYDECREDSDKVRHRAYWLYPQSNTNQGRPHFVNAGNCNHMTPLPVLHSPSIEDSKGMASYAVFTPTNHSFDLWLNGTNAGRFELPTYKHVNHKVGRALLTPLAVGLDVGTLPIQYR